jgi:hypothetical protein
MTTETNPGRAGRPLAIYRSPLPAALPHHDGGVYGVTRSFHEPSELPPGFGVRWQAKRDTALGESPPNLRALAKHESAVAAVHPPQYCYGGRALRSSLRFVPAGCRRSPKKTMAVHGPNARPMLEAEATPAPIPAGNGYETQKRNRSVSRTFGAVCRICLVGFLLALTGCSLFRFQSAPPKAHVSSQQLTDNVSGPVTPTALQARIMRFADIYVATIAQTCDDIMAKATNSDVRLALLRWKLGQATAAYTDATGQNPAVNTLDMLVLLTMARMVVEDYGVETYGDAVLPLLETQRNLETNAWTWASGVLKPSQQLELRELIKEWRAKNPRQRYVGPIRFREFVSGLGRTPTKATSAPTSIFSLLYLDPLAGLDPTAAAIEETREMGERAMYYTQRMPMLLSWQVEVLAYQLADQPESKQILDDAGRLATSAEMFAKTATQLPQLVNDQRQAAIQQVLDGLRSQETDVRQTLNAGADAATAINGAIQSLDKFVRYVYTPDANQTAGSTNGTSFNVLDYGKAAGQVGDAAKNLNTLLTTMNQSTPQLAQLGQQTTTDAKQVVDHAYRRGLELILVFLGGLLVTGLIYRILARLLTGGGRKSSGSDPGTLQDG